MCMSNKNHKRTLARERSGYEWVLRLDKTVKPNKWYFQFSSGIGNTNY